MNSPRHDTILALVETLSLSAAIVIVPALIYGETGALTYWYFLEVLFCSFVLADLIMDIFLAKVNGITVSRILKVAMAATKTDPHWRPQRTHAFWGYFIGIIVGGMVGLGLEYVSTKYGSSLTTFIVLTAASAILLPLGFQRLISTDRTHLIPRPDRQGKKEEGEDEGPPMLEGL